MLWQVQPEFLDVALEAVEADYGGVPAYLEKALSVGPTERERLASLYLRGPG